MKFPPSYRAFLQKIGALAFAGDTYYGITKDGLTSNSVPCVAFATVKARFQNDADDGMVVIKSSGYGPIYSIDTSSVDSNGESPVIETGLSFKRDKDKIIVSPSFEVFFSSAINDAIKEL
ncbi:MULTISPECIES: SMI1/KNR4 family protein [Pseudomonas]|uniref:SMI1/KNR4 family protein n=1 Tax=Pseudomonas TaxID=286 RepID=UPI002D21B267|nr:SMI1/KNR4 family protein [Pseudomonas sp. LY10J]